MFIATSLFLLFIIHAFAYSLDIRLAKEDKESLEEKMKSQFKNEELKEIRLGSEKNKTKNSQSEKNCLAGGKLTRKEKRYISFKRYPTDLGKLVEIVVKEGKVKGTFMMNQDLHRGSHMIETFELDIDKYENDFLRHLGRIKHTKKYKGLE